MSDFVYRDNSGPASTTSWNLTAGATATINGKRWVYHPETYSTSTVYLSPDLLGYDRIGAADTFRGRVVRAFFWLMRAWPVRPGGILGSDG